MKSNVKRKQKHYKRCAWTKPLSVTAGFLAFCFACGALDAHALAASYTVPEPEVVVEEVYVDPQQNRGGECLITARGNDYDHVTVLPLESSADSAPHTGPVGTAAVSAADAAGIQTTISAESYFAPRFRALYSPYDDLPYTGEKKNAGGQEKSSPEDGGGQDAAGDEEQEKSSPSAKETEEEGGTQTVKIPGGTGGGYAKMQSWQKQNSDVMGYLSIPGTNIDYPVVQGATNSTYLTLGYDKQYSYNGVIWADQDVTSKSNNIVLYGHNWTNYSANPRIGDPNDVMFAQLTAYQHLSFAQSHPTIQYADASGGATYVIFAALYTTDLNFYINTSVSAASLAAKAKGMSLHNFSVDVDKNDTILTLSTCTRYFGSFENQRFVVMARKLRPDEKLSTIEIS